MECCTLSVVRPAGRLEDAALGAYAAKAPRAVALGFTDSDQLLFSRRSSVRSCLLLSLSMGSVDRNRNSA